MLITEIRFIDTRKALIIFDEEPSFRLYKGEINKYHLREGIELSPDIYNEIIIKVIRSRCFKRAMFLLSKKDYTVSRLVSKLELSEYPVDIIFSVTEELISLNYLNDIRFAENYISFRRGTKSLKSMKQMLMFMGISREDIETAILNLTSYNADPAESDRISATKDLNKKLKRIKDTDERVIRNKLYSFLASKGYSYKLINALIDEQLK